MASSKPGEDQFVGAKSAEAQGAERGCRDLDQNFASAHLWSDHSVS